MQKKILEGEKRNINILFVDNAVMQDNKEVSCLCWKIMTVQSAIWDDKMIGKLRLCILS